MAEPKHHKPNEAGTAYYERTDTDVWTIVKWLIILLFATGVVMYLMSWVFTFMRAQADPGQPVSPLAEGTFKPPEPRLEAYPGVQLQNLRQYENERLTTYGWADRANGTVHIPIDKAKELLLQRGLPVRKDPGPAQSVPTPHPNMTESNRQDGTAYH
jgi:hypothetical protein